MFTESWTGDASAELADHVAKLFPEGTVAVQVRGTVSPTCLLEEERIYISRGVDRRIREFSAGRLCAHAALSALGFAEAPLLPGPDRVPKWPSGVTGSISHSGGYCVAVAGYTSKFAGLGVDAEWVHHLRQPSIWSLILCPEEISVLNSLPELQRSQMAAVMFASKEAFYKCHYAVTHGWVEFHDVMISVSHQTFHVKLRDKGGSIWPAAGFANGRFLRDGNLIVSGISASGECKGQTKCDR